MKVDEYDQIIVRGECSFFASCQQKFCIEASKIQKIRTKIVSLTAIWLSQFSQVFSIHASPY